MSHSVRKSSEPIFGSEFSVPNINSALYIYQIISKYYRFGTAVALCSLFGTQVAICDKPD